MKIAAGADHAGFALKEAVVNWLRAQGHEVVDYGTTSADAVDYPQYGHLVAEAVSAGTSNAGCSCAAQAWACA